MITLELPAFLTAPKRIPYATVPKQVIARVAVAAVEEIDPPVNWWALVGMNFTFGMIAFVTYLWSQPIATPQQNKIPNLKIHASHTIKHK